MNALADNLLRIMDIPQKDRENDQETMNKEAIHEMNKKLEHEAHAHENPNMGHEREHNPTHHDIGNK
jgi:hypothetical protein